MPSLPIFRKSNPAASPILILALTSKTIPPSDMYDAADTVLLQRLSQVQGVAEVTVAGAEQPAIRVRVNPMLLSTMGLAIEDVRTAIANANALAPLGIIDGAKRAIALETNAQLRTVDDYKRIIIKTVERRRRAPGGGGGGHAGDPQLALGGHVQQPAGDPATITKSGDANVIDTVDRIRELLPEIKRWIPEGIDISILSDRTTTLRASVHDMQLTLPLSIVLVMIVVYVFLRRPTPTIAAGITVPLSLAGTCAAMWAAGFSINNLTLMALAVSVGFVVDDAIVMIENMFRNLERGAPPMRAALDGARQIGFTVISISVSLVAAFIPLLFMQGIVGRLLREFSVTLAFAIAVSTVVSLTVTPMVCAHFVRSGPSADATRLDRAVGGRHGLDGARLCRHARRGAAPPRHDHAGPAADRRRDGKSLHRDSEGLLPAGRHRSDIRVDARFRRHLLRGHGQAAGVRRSKSCFPIPPLPASAPRSARPDSMPRSTRGACSSA